MRKRKEVTAVIMGLLFLTMTSCAAVVAGGAGAAAAYTYLAGWLERDYQVPLEQAYQASMEALQEQDMKIVDETRDVASANIRAETPDQTYWLRLESKGEELTNISIRAGLLGNEVASKQLHRDIEDQM